MSVNNRPPLLILAALITLCISPSTLAEDADYWQAEMDAGKAEFDKQAMAEAYKHYAKALTISTTFKSNDQRLFKTYSALGLYNHRQKGHLAESENFYVKALAFAEAQPKFSQIELVQVVWPLAQVYASQEKYKDATEIFEKGKGVDDVLLTLKEPGAHDAIVQSSKHLNNLGVIYITKKQYVPGELAFNEAIRIQPEYKTAFTNRALVRREQQNFKGADEDNAKIRELEAGK